jgi:putative Holliday junction resolvase
MLLTLADLYGRLGHMQRLLGIDPGSKRVGLALSDVRRSVASPYGTIPRGRLRVNAAEIAAIAAREDVGGLVVGFPLSMDGTLGPAAQAARDWARALSEVTSLPATLWDERQSTETVTRVLIEAADLGRRRRAALVDRMAASHILQGALDAAAALHAVLDAPDSLRQNPSAFGSLP